MNKVKVFIEGRSGTTGLQIEGRMELREDVELIRLPEEARHDPDARREAIRSADYVFLCLPDAAAVQSADMAVGSSARVIDASTAHRTDPAWAYGFPELGAEFRRRIAKAQFVANPGCHATGFISLIYPLVHAGILPPDTPLSCFSLTGYTGGGKKMISSYEDPARDPELDSARIYGLTLSHKHIPEMMYITGLTEKPIFSPIVCDFPQGMLTSVPLFLEKLPGNITPAQIQETYSDFYAGEKNIRVLPLGTPASGFLGSNNVVGTNRLNIYVLSLIHI